MIEMSKDCWCKTNNKDKKEAIAAAQPLPQRFFNDWILEYEWSIIQQSFISLPVLSHDCKPLPVCWDCNLFKSALREKLSSLNALVEDRKKIIKITNTKNASIEGGEELGLTRVFVRQELGPRIDQLGGEIRSANVELNKNKAVCLAPLEKFEMFEVCTAGAAFFHARRWTKPTPSECSSLSPISVLENCTSLSA